MFKKKLLLIIMIVVLLAAAMILTGCKQGKEKEAKQLLEEMFPDSTPTPEVTPEPTPTPEPEKVGFYFSDDFNNRLASLWPASKPISDFGDRYMIYGDFNSQDNSTQVVYTFFPAMTEEEARIYYGQLIFGLNLTESYWQCTFVGETNDQGGPLDVTFQIAPMPSGLEVYLIFDLTSGEMLIADLHDTYWPSPDNPFVHVSLHEEPWLYRGFSYNSWGDPPGLYRMWALPPGQSQVVYDWYRGEYVNAYGYAEDVSPTTLVPRTTFYYDITGDGRNVVKFRQCPIFVEAYPQVDLFRMAVGAD